MPYDPRKFLHIDTARVFLGLLRDKRVSRNEALVGLGLSCAIDKTSLSTYIDAETLGKNIGLSVRTTLRALASLKEKSLIHRRRRFNASSLTNLKKADNMKGHFTDERENFVDFVCLREFLGLLQDGRIEPREAMVGIAISCLITQSRMTTTKSVRVIASRAGMSVRSAIDALEFLRADQHVFRWEVAGSQYAETMLTPGATYYGFDPLLDVFEGDHPGFELGENVIDAGRGNRY